MLKSCIWHENQANPHISEIVTIVVGYHFIDRIRERLGISDTNQNIINFLNKKHKDIMIYNNIPRIFSQSMRVTIPYDTVGNALFAISVWNTDSVEISTHEHKTAFWTLKDYRK